MQCAYHPPATFWLKPVEAWFNNSGPQESYYLLASDAMQDSNMQLTLLSHTLDKVCTKLAQSGRQVPQNLVVQADNTCRETRNQWAFKWAAILLLRGLFRSITFNFLPVGHTHLDLDQRFSIITTALSRQRVLETPEATHTQTHTHTLIEGHLAT